jgi:hypothetical protein
MIEQTYLHIPQTFERTNESSLTLNEQYYIKWNIDTVTDYFKIPIYWNNSFSINQDYTYSDLSLSLDVFPDVFNLLYNGGNKLLVIVDEDNIPRTPFISSSNRLLTTNMYRVSLTLRPLKCYRLYTYRPVSEYVSYKVLNDGLGGVVTFDPPFTLLISQIEVVVE